jgi:hypothetical protein
MCNDGSVMRRAGILFLLVGCAPKAAPAAEPAAPVHDEATTSPRDVEFAYRSSSEDEPDEGDGEAEAPAEPADAQPAALPEPTELSAIGEQAVLAAMTEHASVLLTPALPIEWPAKPGEVVYVAYPIEPLATGVTKWRVGRPIARVVVKLADKSASVEKLEPKNNKPLGTFENERESATDPIHAAEATLFTIVAGQGDAEKVRHRLRPYLDWIDAHPVLRADLRERAPAFLAWLSET